MRPRCCQTGAVMSNWSFAAFLIAHSSFRVSAARARAPAGAMVRGAAQRAHNSGGLVSIVRHLLCHTYNKDSAEEPLWSKSDSEKDHLRCIPRQFKSRTDEASAYEFSTVFMHLHSSSKTGGSSAESGL